MGRFVCLFVVCLCGVFLCVCVCVSFDICAHDL